MTPAFTLYKFRKILGLVFIIFITLIVLSIINPIKSEVTNDVVNKVDSTGLASKVINLDASIKDPVSEVKQVSGNFLYRLLQNNPLGFLGLVLVTGICLFGTGFYLRDLRLLLRGL